MSGFRGVFSEAVAGGLRYAGWCVVAGSCVAAGASQPRIPPDSWQQANASRVRFEAAPSHGRLEYAEIMTEYRAIYHSNPRDAHAAAAVEVVAELLVEEGRELHDDKAMRDAAGQYEFLARQYPTSPLAGPSLAAEAYLFGPDVLGDAVEAKRATTELKKKSPKTAAGLLAKKPALIPEDVPRKAAPAGAKPYSPITPTKSERKKVRNPPLLVADLSRDARLGVAAVPAPPVDLPQPAATSSATKVDSGSDATAKVTGIRHWSTASYTRVAIDLGDEVEYKAVRVEHPDRIFFDLHHAHLAPALVGKSFAVTDDGFLTRIRAAQYSDDVTRVVLDVHEVTDYSAFLLPNPYRLIIDIHGKAQGPGPRAQGPDSAVVDVPRAKDGVVSGLPPMPVTDGSAGFGLPPKTVARDVAVAAPRVVIPVKPTSAKPVPNTVVSRTGNSGTEVAEVSDQPGKVEATRKPTSAPISEKTSGARVQKASRVDLGNRAAPALAAPPTADGETSLMRALGLKIGRIVIDAGHGGHDSGTLGVDGIQEKDVVLDVALRLGKLLHQRMGAEIVYTRADDTFIPLETRTAIANKAQADLFISVHANSSPDASARGVEVYYLNFTSDPEAMQVAGRENAVSTKSVHELSDLVKKIALKDKIDESRELAGDVEGSLYAGLEKGNEGLKDRGVKKAPFVVLIGANMPSILAEISFVTNPDDADQLRTPEYRQRVAESLFNGVARYAAGINGVKMPVVKVASAGSKTQGPGSRTRTPAD
jgi:N-acetylmuramoyl-L-alanine amidase